MKKKEYEKYRMLSTLPKEFDTFVVIATTSGFDTFICYGIGSFVILISTVPACGLPFTKKAVYGLGMKT